MKIEVGKWYKAEHGPNVKILAKEESFSKDFPYVGVRKNLASNVIWYNEDGGSDGGLAPDLIAEFREPREFWVNEYSDNDLTIHTSKADADNCFPGSARKRVFRVIEIIE